RPSPGHWAPTRRRTRSSPSPPCRRPTTAPDQPQPLPWNSCSTEQCGRLPNFFALAQAARAWLFERPPLKISASQLVAEILCTWVLNPSFLAALATRVASAPLPMCPPRMDSHPDEEALAGEASAPIVINPATAAPTTRRAAPRFPPAMFTSVPPRVPSYTDVGGRWAAVQPA